jgi:hypothetical protein
MADKNSNFVTLQPNKGDPFIDDILHLKSLTKSIELLCSFIKSAQLPCVLLPTSIQINERNCKNEAYPEALEINHSRSPNGTWLAVIRCTPWVVQ